MKANKIRINLTISPAVMQAVKAKSESSGVAVSAAAERLLSAWAADGLALPAPAGAPVRKARAGKVATAGVS